jgi:hypothetical protein
MPSVVPVLEIDIHLGRSSAEPVIITHRHFLKDPERGRAKCEETHHPKVIGGPHLRAAPSWA